MAAFPKEDDKKNKINLSDTQIYEIAKEVERVLYNKLKEGKELDSRVVHAVIKYVSERQLQEDVEKELKAQAEDPPCVQAAMENLRELSAEELAAVIKEKFSKQLSNVKNIEVSTNWIKYTHPFICLEEDTIKEAVKKAMQITNICAYLGKYCNRELCNRPVTQAMLVVSRTERVICYSDGTVEIVIDGQKFVDKDTNLFSHAHGAPTLRTFKVWYWRVFGETLVLDKDDVKFILDQWGKMKEYVRVEDEEDVEMELLLSALCEKEIPPRGSILSPRPFYIEDDTNTLYIPIEYIRSIVYSKGLKLTSNKINRKLKSLEVYIGRKKIWIPKLKRYLNCWALDIEKLKQHGYEPILKDEVTENGKEENSDSR